MKQIYLAAIFACTGTVGQAACATNLQTFLSCEVGRSGKVLNVCFDDTIITYSFGRPGAPDLGLAETIADIDYTPWPGVGRSIWEEVRFENGEYSYITHAGFERMLGDETDEDNTDTHFGGVVVERGGDVIADLQCTPGTVDAPWGQELFLAKEAAGLTWDFGAREWQKTNE